jgi:hypothetical protein
MVQTMTASAASPALTVSGELPSRKELRTALLAFSEKSTATALRLIVVDYALFVAGVALVAAPTHWLVKLAASLLVWVQIARLFIIGHDACHQSLTDSRSLNKWLGRLVFLPSLTPFKLWELGHNMAHHGFTNLRGKDYVWAPFSPAEFAQLPRARQWLERCYRSGSGHWLYYLVELWWKKLYFPSRVYGRLSGGKRVWPGMDWRLGCSRVLDTAKRLAAGGLGFCTAICAVEWFDGFCDLCPSHRPRGAVVPRRRSMGQSPAPPHSHHPYSVPAPHRRSAAQHHGTPGASLGHDHSALPTAGCAKAIGCAGARPDIETKIFMERI